MASLEQDIFDRLLALSVDINRAEAGTRKRVLKEMKALEKGLVAAINEFDPTESARASTRQAKLSKLLDSTRELIKESYKAIRRVVNEDVKGIAVTTASGTIASVNVPSGYAILSNKISQSTIDEIARGTLIQGAKSSEWWSRQAGNASFRFANEMRDAMLKGESVGDMVRRIRGTYNSATGQYVGGIMNTLTRHAESLARTSVINTSNQARLRVFEENDDVIEGIEWVAALDSRTTPICRALDGLVWDLNYKPVGHKYKWPGATAHWACRSTQIPTLKEFKQFPKKKQKKLDSKRFSKDGDIPANKSYNDWLVKQNKQTQIDVLGEKKRALWKENKLTTRDMVNFNNRPLTVAELEKKYGK